MRASQHCLLIATLFMPTLSAAAQGPLHVCKHPDTVTAVAFSKNGKLLATGGADNQVRLWDPTTFKEQRQLGGHRSRVTALVFIGDDKLVSGNFNPNDATYNTWTITGNQAVQASHQISSQVTCLAAAPDGTYQVVGQPNSILMLPINNPRGRVHFLNPGRKTTAMTFAADSKTLASAGDKAVFTWDADSGKQLRQLTVDHDGPQSLTLSPDGKLLAAGCKDTVYLWDSAGKERARMGGHRGAINAIAFSADGKMLASAGADGTVQVWDPVAGKLLKTLGKHKGQALAVAFAPNSQILASGGEDKTLMIWDISPRIFIPAKPVELTAKVFDDLWEQLGSDDFAKANQAVGTLAASKQAIPLLCDRVRAAGILDREKRVSQLLAQLDDDQFAVRERATQELEKLGPLAAPHLQKTIDSKLPLEVRRRAERVLEKLKVAELSPELSRWQRSLTVLELLGTPEARQALTDLAKGDAGAWLALEAKASLDRLEKKK
jgi:hypothetical protein